MFVFCFPQSSGPIRFVTACFGSLRFPVGAVVDISHVTAPWLAAKRCGVSLNSCLSQSRVKRKHVVHRAKLWLALMSIFWREGDVQFGEKYCYSSIQARLRHSSHCLLLMVASSFWSSSVAFRGFVCLFPSWQLNSSHTSQLFIHKTSLLVTECVEI